MKTKKLITNLTLELSRAAAAWMPKRARRIARRYHDAAKRRRLERIVRLIVQEALAAIKALAPVDCCCAWWRRELLQAHGGGTSVLGDKTRFGELRAPRVEVRGASVI